MTTEIAIAPDGASVGTRFLWRLSMADVATDGPFSRFEGYHRHIMIVEGAGMSLDCGAHGRIELGERFAPCTFSGDWDVRGTLVRGAVRDLNLIVDREQASSSLEVRVLDTPVAMLVTRAGVCLVHVLEGALEGAECGDTLVAERSFELNPVGRARVAVARVMLASSG